MDTRTAGVAVAVLGVVLVIAGLLYAAGWLSWFGRLPGDIRYASGGTRVYFPITTMILLSVGLSLALFIGRRLF